jgi:acyl-CoA reductase-like NAD-dependent aldehyde dehydrogenase
MTDSHGQAAPPAEVRAAIDALVGNALKALAEYDSFTQEQVDHIVKKVSVAALGRHAELAALAVEETGRGVFEDKAVKNIFACEHITHSMADLKTAGVVSRDEINGIVEIADPVGVVCGITPVTNPTSTTVFKALLAMKTRNPIVFAFHPSAQRCSAEAARIVRDAAIAAGAPEYCVQWVEEPSLVATGALMHHDGVSVILATGGNAMVKAAYSAGKPALGVGAGNVPAYIERSAKLRRAVHDIVLSKTFDNGMICASEQAAVILVPVAEVGPAEPLTREKLCPVLAVLRAGSREQGLAYAEQMVEFHGLGHSAVIHTEDAALAEEYGRRVKAVRVIWNAPASQGGIGDMYNAFLPSLTLGCGSYGHNSVSNNVTAVNPINIKRIGRRNNNCSGSRSRRRSTSSRTRSAI